MPLTGVCIDCYIAAMTLDDFLSETETSSAAFALKVKASRSQISRIRRGVSRPSWDLLARIEAATDRRVTAGDFMEPA